PDGQLNIASLGAGDLRAGARAGRGGAAGAGTGGTGAAALAQSVRIEKGTVTYVARGGAGALTRYRAEDVDLTLTAGAALRFDGGGHRGAGESQDHADRARMPRAQGTDARLRHAPARRPLLGRRAPRKSRGDDERRGWDDRDGPDGDARPRRARRARQPRRQGAAARNGAG